MIYAVVAQGVVDGILERRNLSQEPETASGKTVFEFPSLRRLWEVIAVFEWVNQAR